MRCPNCGVENPLGMNFCEECGTKLAAVCSNCGHEIRPAAKFCGQCGTALTSKAKGKRQKAKKVASNQLSVVSLLQPPTPQTPNSEPRTVQPPDAPRPTLHALRAEAERRQLTVMFCDLVGSTALSTQLDPEELREVIQVYRETCAVVIRRFEGHLAKYIGDGLFVEDKSQSSSSLTPHSAFAIPQSHTPHPSPLPKGAREFPPLQVRIGIHTGLVVAGEMGTEDQPEPLGIVGETPNIAARLQEKAVPNSVVISPTTYRLVPGLFECEELGPQTLKGISIPLTVYQVVRESAVQSRFEAAVQTGLTPLVGRAEELALLHRRWQQAKEGEGQVVLLSGEPGIGKSRLVQELKEQLVQEGVTCIEFRCSPYHQNSALYPIIEHLQRMLQFARGDTPAAKLEKLQYTLSHYRFPQSDAFPLLAALLSLPHPEGIPPITLSPQKQKQKTQEALVAWIIEEAEKTAAYCAWEDLHWVDPSTLEVLTLFLDQVPTTRLLALLTFRPEFIPPWGNRSHLSQITLGRLGRPQVGTMVEKITGSKALPSEVVEQIVVKTDGVPLFVEELTKMVVEQNVGAYCNTPLLGIPVTLQDALMARLDRLGPAKEIAQLGAVLGREFSHEILQAISPLDEETLQRGLKQLVDAELVYQRGLLSQAHYLFKHALIQDTAYQSLLKSIRQQYHRQIAQVLAERFKETVETQPELLAHHYTEAGLITQAIPYWQRAGQRAVARSANSEAISHLTRGLKLLKTLPDTPERVQQELTLQIALGVPLGITKGYASPEAGTVYNRARELCQQVGETPQLCPVLWGLWRVYNLRADFQTARELGEQLLFLAQRYQDRDFLLQAHHALWSTLIFLGEFTLTREHLEQGLALYNPQQHRSHALLYGGHDPGVCGLAHAAWVLWLLGYPDQALKSSQEAIILAQELSHPYSLAMALGNTYVLHQFRREVQTAQEQAEALIALSSEQGFPAFLAQGTIVRGWALAGQGQGEEGLTQMRQGLAAYRATGAELGLPYQLARMAEVYGRTRQAKEGLSVLAEALAAADKTSERRWAAELYRLKGELTLAQSQASLGQVKTSQDKSEDTDSRPLTPDPQGEAEACFLKAIEVARRQSAKSLELRAVMSLSRLWQQQGRQKEAHDLLSEIYGWFREGFDTKDLQEAKTLLEELQG